MFSGISGQPDPVLNLSHIISKQHRRYSIHYQAILQLELPSKVGNGFLHIIRDHGRLSCRQ